VKDLFEDWLGRHFPDRKEKVLSRIRSMREGKLNDANFHSRMEGKGLFAEQIGSLFHTSCKKYGLNEEYLELSTGRYRRDTAPDLFNS
jgi:DNA repair photolyase